MTALRLDGAHVSLVLLARAQGLPEIVHWGRRLPDAITADELRAARTRALRRNAIDEDYVEASLMPTAGGVSLRQPGLQVHRAGRDWTAWFETRSIVEATGRIVVEASDPVARLSLTITLTLAPGSDVLTMRSSLRNEGDDVLDVQHLAAGTFLVPAAARTLLSFDGHWSREFFERRVVLETGRFTVENRRGRASHDRHPALIAGTDGFDDESGEVWGVHLGWSGNHTTGAEVLEDGAILLSTGELLQAGEVRLAPGERLETPVAHAGFSSEGLSGLSRALHAHVRSEIVRWPQPGMARPVTLNTWEGNYFDHDLDRLKRQADAAQRLGIERFVLDDGWMRGRDHDRAGLGDWQADLRKYPDGLGPLISHVRGLGMQFGLWVEPEMVNPDSDLFRTHPDAVLRTEGRRLVEGRGQLVLDLGRDDIAARIFGDLDALLTAHPIAALKWDMNRDLVAASGRDGAAAYRRHVQATWGLIDRLRAAHPSVEIESCASGGGRADYGVLARTHRVWASDCTDALERLSIQRGLSRLLPPELVGAHVSASPNHQTGRRHTIGFRSAAALFFHFGVEMDPLTLTAAEAEELGGWIALHKRLRPLLHAGSHQCAVSSDGRSLRGVVSADRSHGAFLVAQETAPVRRMPSPCRLPGLLADMVYRVALPAPQEQVFAGGVFSGALLSVCGLCLPVMQPETAMVLDVTRVG